MMLASPWAFVLLLLIPVILWLDRRTQRQTGTIHFSTTRNAARAGRSLRQRLAGIPLALRIITLILLSVALARPQRGLERVRDTNKGIAIEMVVDHSGSMSAELEFKGEQINRLEIVKRVFEEFVLGNKHDLKGRPNDLIGMIVFARYPDTICPLTLAHGALPRFLENVQLVQQQSEDGTAIGDAVALAAARLKTAEETLAAQLQDKGNEKEYEIKSKVIILLTDGENNCGRRDPRQAAELAAKWGIKIYTIGVGGESVMSIPTLFGPRKMLVGSGIDEDTLRSMAEITGGVYRRADTAEALQAVYREIDELERSEIESVRYMDYREKFVPFALAAFVLLCLEIFLRCIVFRRIP